MSFPGSVRFAEVLYNGLLSGTDPRQLIYDLRRRLYTQFPSTHDWASVTAYLSMPNQFDHQLSRLKINQAMESVNAAMSYADEVTRRESSRIQSKRRSESTTTQTRTTYADKLYIDARERMSAGKDRLESLVARIPSERLIYGLLASTEKRQAEVLYRVGSVKSSIDDLASSKKLVVKARDHYWESFLIDRTHHCAVVQYLSLSLLIARTPGLMEQEAKAQSSDTVLTRPEKMPRQLWNLARMLSLYDLHRVDREKRTWAYGNLIELYLLSLLPELENAIPQDEARRIAIDHTDELIDIAGWD